MKVLQIDDSPEICQLYFDMFSADNHSVESVSNGMDGLKLILKNDYDLILLDMCMPKYSGLHFLRDLKKQRPSELKKVVVVSVLKFDKEHIKEFLEFGIHSIEDKPTDLDSFVAIQKKILLK